MKILGIDPGLAMTGWGVISSFEGTTVCHGYGVVRTKPTTVLERRLLTIFDTLEGIFTQFEPQAVAMERTYVNSNAFSSLKLGLVRGAIMIAVARRNVTLIEYSPSEVKYIVCGHGQGDKQAVAASVAQRMVLAPGKIPSDATDALAVALCYGYVPPIKKKQTKKKLKPEQMTV